MVGTIPLNWFLFQTESLIPTSNSWSIFDGCSIFSDVKRILFFKIPHAITQTFQGEYNKRDCRVLKYAMFIIRKQTEENVINTLGDNLHIWIENA